MDDLMREQARQLHRTVRLLRNRVIKQHASITVPNSGNGGMLELSIPQVNLLLTVRDNSVMTMKELAVALEVSPPSASVMVDRLVDLGLLRRQPSQSDRREVQISVSNEGARLVDEMEDQLLESIVEILEKVGPDCAKKWCEVYDRIRAVLVAQSPGVSPREGVGSTVV